MFKCAHNSEPVLDSYEPPNGWQWGEPWRPTAVCRLCRQRFELRPEQMYRDGVDGRGGLTEWFALELIAYNNFEWRDDPYWREAA